MHTTLNYVVAVACTLFAPIAYAQSVRDNPGPSLMAAVANADDKSSPIYGVTIPAGNRQWDLIAVSQENRPPRRVTGNSRKRVELVYRGVGRIQRPRNGWREGSVVVSCVFTGMNNQGASLRRLRRPAS